MKPQWWKNINWKDPKVIVSAIAAALLPFAAGVYVKMGVFIGVLKALGLLWMVDKLPRWIKVWMQEHKLASDVGLTALVTFLTAGVFGDGLTLAISATTCALVLSWAIPRLQIEPETQPQAQAA